MKDADLESHNCFSFQVSQAICTENIQNGIGKIKVTNRKLLHKADKIGWGDKTRAEYSDVETRVLKSVTRLVCWEHYWWIAKIQRAVISREVPLTLALTCGENEWSFHQVQLRPLSQLKQPYNQC